MSESNDPNVEEVICPCFHCRSTKTLMLDPAAVTRWRNGELIQDVFPELSPEVRELMISGTCPDCWNRMFGGDDDLPS